jgi:hypothetical protein
MSKFDETSLEAFCKSRLAEKLAGRFSRARLPFRQKLEIAEQLRTANAAFSFARFQNRTQNKQED